MHTHVDDTPLTEVPTGPTAGQYTIDDETGRIAFGTPPIVGVDNIVTTYKACRLSSPAIDEACRQFSLSPTATAETGRPAAVLSAAALACDWLASMTAGDFDFETDGQSFKRGSVAGQFAARAESLRSEAASRSGLVSVSLTRIDGYSAKGEYAGVSMYQSQFSVCTDTGPQLVNTEPLLPGRANE